MARRIHQLLGLLSLATLLLVLALWIDSYWSIVGIGNRPSPGIWYEAFSDRGRLCFEKIDRSSAAPSSNWFLESIDSDFAEERFTPIVKRWWAYHVPCDPEPFLSGTAHEGYLYDPFWNRLVPRSWNQRWGLVSPPECIVYIPDGAAPFWNWERNYSSDQGSPCRFSFCGLRFYKGYRILPGFVSGRGSGSGISALHTGRLVAIPYAYLAVAAALVAFIFNSHPLRRAHRRRHGRCPACGYDLRASKERCPECGRPISRTEKRRSGNRTI